MADVDLEIKKGETYPGIKGYAFDAKGPLDLPSAEKLEVRIKGGATFITGEAEAIDPIEEVTIDGKKVKFNWKYLWAEGDTDTLGTDYQIELWVYVDDKSTPKRIQKLPNELTANPTMAIVQDLIP